MPWTTPKTDWDTNPTNPLPSDFNRIEGNIDFLNIDIETKKGLIVNALSSVGIAALIADTHVQLASKITGAKKTGVSIIPGTANQEIPKGIYDTGGGTVLGDPDLISANIKAGANIFGVAGNSNVVDTSGGDATAAQILSGKKAYVDGALVTGSIPSKGAATITPGTVNQTIAAEQYLSGIQTILGDADLVAANIKSGINIFGVIGNYLGPGIKRIIPIDLSTISSSTYATTYTYTLPNACVLKNSFIILIPQYSGNTQFTSVSLTNTTTITFSKPSSVYNWMAGIAYFIEFNEGIIKSKQLVTVPYYAGLSDIAITTVDPTKSIVFGSSYYKHTSNDSMYAQGSGYVYSATLIRVWAMEFTQYYNGLSQVIEFY